MTQRPDDTRLHDWLDETVGPTPDPVEGTQQVMSQVEETSQVGRWLPFPLLHRKAKSKTPTTEYQPSSIPATSGRSPTVIGRTHSMFSPAKAITAGALVFAIGGVLLIAQPFDQQGNVPGAATDSEPVNPVEFTATFPWGPESDPGSVGTDSHIGWSHRTKSSESSDPRFEGELVYTTNSLTYPSEGGPPLKVWNSVMRVENDEGAWQSRPANEVEFSDGTWSVFTMVFDGEEGYEGLTAVVEVEEWSTDPRTGGYDWHGVIVGGDLPPDAEQFVGE